MQAGYPSLGQAAKATVQRILAAQPLHPGKVKYHLERRDPDFEAKMREIQLVYQEVALQNQNRGGIKPVVVTVSADEKPGLQAVDNTVADLPPVPGEHTTFRRDHEYKRLGTCSILAAVDLHNGHVTARVERRHRSREFIALLKDLDCSYPAECMIRLILDNHAAHILQEARAFFATRPNRFKYVLIPQAWVVAQPGRDALWQEDSHVSATYPDPVLGGALRSNSQRHPRNQYRACRRPLEEVRRICISLIRLPFI